jgi:hypothetical protein
VSGVSLYGLAAVDDSPRRERMSGDDGDAASLIAKLGGHLSTQETGSAEDEDVFGETRSHV